jgi:hypothetical protein
MYYSSSAQSLHLQWKKLEVQVTSGQAVGGCFGLLLMGAIIILLGFQLLYEFF